MKPSSNFANFANINRQLAAFFCDRSLQESRNHGGDRHPVQPGPNQSTQGALQVRICVMPGAWGRRVVKGLVFTTFYDYCEISYGADFLDEVIAEARLPHRGAYTSVGTYPFSEMISLITALVAKSGQDLKPTLEAFGAHCFATWVKNWPVQFDGRCLFDVLASIDDFHEQEVRKLYPDAELPSFKVETRSPDRLVLGYHSCKPLADLAVGVIRGAADYLHEPVSITSRTARGARGNHVRIEINRLG